MIWTVFDRLRALVSLPRRVARLEDALAEHRLRSAGDLADVRCELEDARSQVDELYVGGVVRR